MQNVKKHSSNNFLSLIKLLIYIISLISFVLSFIFDNVYLIIISIPFILVLLCFVHEIGHFIGCKIKNKDVKYIKVFSFKYEDNKISIIPGVSFGGVVSFRKDQNNSKIVYALGPIFSLIFTIIVLLLFILIRANILFVLLILSIVTLFCVTIPYRGSDIYNLINNGGKSNGKEN